MKIVLMVSETLGEKDNKMQGKDGPELIKKAQKKNQNKTEQNKTRRLTVDRKANASKKQSTKSFKLTMPCSHWASNECHKCYKALGTEIVTREVEADV